MPQTPAIAPPSPWRFFPWAVAGCMGIVIAVNLVLVVFAAASFPGNVGSDGFTLSNRYNQVLETAGQDATPGWDIATTLIDGNPALTLRDRTGAPLVGARVQVLAQRPVGPQARTPFPMHAVADGRLTSDTALPAPGQWDLTITVTAGNQSMTTTRRVFQK